MAVVTARDLQKFNNVQIDNVEDFQLFAEIAQNMVEDFLGYELKRRTYVKRADGNGLNWTQLEARPIIEILRAVIDGRDYSPSLFRVSNEFIYFRQGETFPRGYENVQIVYDAGYEETDASTGRAFDGGEADTESDFTVGDADASTEAPIVDAGDALKMDDGNAVPPVIKSAIVRIAALMFQETSGNIGITGKSFGESGSRTFVNYVNYQKYLMPISNYRLTVI